MPAHLDDKYESLVAEFLKTMNDIGRYGSEKYPHTDFKLALARGENPDFGTRDMIQHVLDHIKSYEAKLHHDHFHTLKHQLAAAAFNLMMEFIKQGLETEQQAGE